jgi:RNA polymerase sigma-70 factor (ECF subfamily)
MTDQASNNSAADQAELIFAVATRQDRSAFAALFDHFAPRIKSLLMRSGTPAETAEDMAQEAMMSVWRKASYFDPARASASTWIFTIARNLRIDAARRQKREEVHAAIESVEPEGPEQPDEVVDIGRREARVREALKILPPDQLDVVKLAFVEGLTHSEIAQALGLPLGTVKSRMRLAMGRLRGHLEDLK